MPPEPTPLPDASQRFKHRRDLFSAAGLFLASAAFVFWQNAHIAILWDLSYLLDTSWRIALGQVPYRDFPLVHPPLTFLIQAAIMRLAGRHYELHVAYSAVVGGLSAVVAWRILLCILRDVVASAWTISLLLALPLVFLNVQGVYPHPIYDTDCAFAILVAIYLLQRVESPDVARGTLRQWIRPAATGIALVLPVFFKQNMGVPFLLMVVSGIVLLLLASRYSRKIQIPSPTPATVVRLLASIVVTAAGAAFLIHASVGWTNYLRWTVHFAASRRLPGFADMIGIYRQPSFSWTVPTFGCGMLLLRSRLAARLWIRLAAIGLCAAPLAGSLIFLCLNDDLDERADNLLALWPLLLLAAALLTSLELRKGITLSRLMPLFVLAAVHGTFLSQQLWGSSYAIWPLLLVLIAQILACLPPVSRPAPLALAGVVGSTLLVCGGLYAIGHNRMDYVLIPDEPVEAATLPMLRGMHDAGPFLSDFEELLHFAAREIPPQDALLLLPGEDPFYFATGRTPRFPVLLMDRTTDPFSPVELLGEAGRRNVRWVIVKTTLQSVANALPEKAETLQLVSQQFMLVEKLHGYDVYRRL